MAEKYLLECPACGAETDAPASAYGDTVECHACGEDVPVDDAHILQVLRSEAPRTEPPAGAATAGRTETVEAAFGADDKEPEPSDAPNPHSPLREANQTVSGAGRCVRCGREFRGDWDRFEAHDGTICYVCSNLAVEGVPERLRHEQQPETPEPLPKNAERLIEKDLPPPRKQTFLGYDTASPQFRRVLWGAAIAMLAIAWLVAVTDWGSPQTVPAVSEPSVAVEDVPRWLSVSWAIAYRVAGYLVLGVTIYLVLWRRNALPHDRLSRDALDIGIVIGLCAVVGLLATVTGMAVDYGGAIGWIPAAMVWTLGLIVQGAVILLVFDWRPTDLLWGALFFFLARFLVSGALALVFAAVTHLVT